MLASILQEQGYKTGLYTSPHLKSFTERIKVNGTEISEKFVIGFVNRIRPMIEEISPSFFEITVAMAFDYFVQEKVDVAVIEVGLGGRLDSTNVITPLVSVITNIGWDHKDILGDTLPKIASEKAGIIKKNVPVVISERQHNVENVFITKASEENSPINFASDEYRSTILESGNIRVTKNENIFLDDLNLPLKGLYQLKNLSGVFKTIEILEGQNFKVDTDKLRLGLERVVLNTQLKGRWQKLRDQPLVICDTGHNVDGISEVVRQIRALKFNKLHFVLGMVKDKDIQDILKLLPNQATYYFCQAKIPRAMDAQLLAEKAHAVGLHGQVITDVNEAKNAAIDKASADDLVFIGGSTFVVGEIDEL
jgi:dihydrofolate synthase/folylpolyglutamate synthase